MNFRLAALLGAAALAVVGCGTTVTVPRGTSGASNELIGGGDGLSAPATQTPLKAGPGGAQLPAVPSEGAAVGGSSPPGAAGGAQAGAPRTDASNPNTPGPRAATAAGPVQVGFAIVKNNAEAASALGFSSINNGDEKSVVQALVATANTSGGLAGRRITPIFFELDPGSNSSTDEIGQQQCSAFTEDAAVVAVSSTAIVPTLANCLARRGILGIAGNPQQAYAQSELRSLPSIATFGLTQRLQATAIVEAAARQDYFKDGPRVGVVTVDTPRFRDAVTASLLPGLRAKGARTDAEDVFYGPELKRVSDVSALTTAMQSAVLRMRSRGVTHVVFLQDAAAPALLFMQQADSQGAMFRYALSSPDAPQVLVAQGVPARQFRGAVAAGWDPYLDVPVAKAGAPPAGRAWCNRVFSELGLAPGSNAEWIAFMHCDAFALVLASAGKATGEITAVNLVAGLGRVGDIASANVPAARISADHRWATTGYRLNRYDEACGCFSYANDIVLGI